MSGLTPAVEVRDPEEGALLGWVGLDSAICGRSRGGLRMVPDLQRVEIEKLARAMTLKYGLLGLPQGGGKGGLFGDPEAPAAERAKALGRFARAAAELLRERRYVPDADMGTTGREIQQMLGTLGLRVARREHRGETSGVYTAATVLAGARAGAAAQGMEWGGSRVVVEGFGKVGAPLARMCVEAGARVVGVSTRHGGLHEPGGVNVARLVELQGVDARLALTAYAAGHEGSRLVELDELKGLPAEIFCPCARHDSIGVEEVKRMEARVVSCGANSPITAQGEETLAQRGILAVPDFVANCGGVLGGTMEFAGWRADEILRFCGEVFGPRVERLLKEAGRSGRPLRGYCEEVARERFAAVKERAERGSWSGRVVEAGLSVYREGFLPERLVKWASEGYFQRAVG